MKGDSQFLDVHWGMNGLECIRINQGMSVFVFREPGVDKDR